MKWHRAAYDGVLLLVVAIALMLRFYGTPHVPFTFDELSAWGRTGFTSFAQLIAKGVAPDGHPALIQVFLNYYRQLFGDAEWVIKLPFQLMGVAAIAALYLLGKIWFSPAAGLLAAAYGAVLQLFVFHAQTARPYASGLLCSLLMVLFWWKHIAGRQAFSGWLVGFVVMAVLCCYNHYFSMLLAGLVAVTGLFFVHRVQRWSYVLACVGIVVLFLPHLPLMLKQWRLGGLAWLQPPEKDFIFRFLDYTMHFSWWLRVIWLAVIVLAIIYRPSLSAEQQRLWWASMAWFLLSFLIGFLYSHYRAPVLQYAVLIFSYPFLLLGLCALVSPKRPVLVWALTGAILFGGIWSLVFERCHYHVVMHQPIDRAVKRTLVFRHSLAEGQSWALINQPPRYMAYYLRDSAQQALVNAWKNVDPGHYGSFRHMMAQVSADTLVSSNLPYEYALVSREYFPYCIDREIGFTYEWQVWTRNRSEKQIPIVYWSDSLRSDRRSSQWKLNGFQPTEQGYPLTGHTPMGPQFQGLLAELVRHPYDWFVGGLVAAGVSDSSRAMLVVELRDEHGMQHRLTRRLADFVLHSDSLTTAYLAFRVRDFPLSGAGKRIRFYCWNPAGESLFLKNMWVQAEEGNGLIYSTVEAVPRQVRCGQRY